MASSQELISVKLNLLCGNPGKILQCICIVQSDLTSHSSTVCVVLSHFIKLFYLQFCAMSVIFRWYSVIKEVHNLPLNKPPYFGLNYGTVVSN